MTAPSPPTPPPSNGDATPPPSGPNTPSPSAELTQLAAHLRRIADRVDDLDARCDQLTDALTATVLPELSSIRADTTAQLAEHADQVQTLLDTLTPHRPSEPLDWPALNADQAGAAWHDLADWIADTLVPWYEITRDQLPDCWALHRPALVQLNWLHRAYQDAHQPGVTRLTADWHTRWLPAALHAVREAIPRRGPRICGPGQHLVSEADRARATAVHDPQRRSQAGPVALATAQLAERDHWQAFYLQAMNADLTGRHDRGKRTYLINERASGEVG